MPDSQYTTFSEVRERLDQIVVEVRKKDLSLERSLDLYEEAIQLGNRCAELVDKPDYTPEEALAAQEVLEASAPDVAISGAPVEAASQDDQSGDAAEGQEAPQAEVQEEGAADA